MEGGKRNRMHGFDYSSDAIYFITICTKDKIHHFGRIQNGKMNLNEEGKIAEEQILWLKKQYSYFELHNFVVMPNHVHLLELMGILGIIILLKFMWKFGQVTTCPYEANQI